MSLLSGTTITRQIVSLLTTEPDQLLAMHKVPIGQRVCFMDMVHVKNEGSAYERFCRSSPHRLAHTHLAQHVVSHWVLRDRVKVILVLRNPKDTLVSYFHYHNVNPGTIHSAN